MNRRALSLAGVVGLSAFMVVLFLPSRPSVAAPALGGFDNFGFAAPISMLVYEPEIPVPNSPQGELHYSYTEATLQDGPFGAATASSVYPGPTLATGLPQFNSHLPNYPVQTNANYPGSSSETSTSKSVGPGQMSAKASATTVTATALTQPAASTGAVTFGSMSSTTTDTWSPAKVTSTAVTDISNLGLMGSVIQIQHVHAVATAASDAQRGSASGQEVVTGLTVAGQAFTVDQNGVHGPSKLPGIPLPGAPKNGTQLLQQLGISFGEPISQNTVQGTHGQNAGIALTVSVDMKTFHDALNKVPIQQLLSLLPPQTNPCFGPLAQSPTGPCLQDQLSAVLALQTRIVFPVANVSASSNAVPRFVVPPFSGSVGLPPTTTTVAGTPGTPGTPGVAGLSGGTAGGAPAPDVAGPGTTTVASESPAGYNGLKTAALLGALAALLTWYAVRNLGLAVVGGFAGCEHGAPRTVPDLRRG